ncbi:MAG: competence protein CoiA family protein [Promethearchaeota archaeon]
MEDKEVLIVLNVELNQIFNLRYRRPKNPEKYTWICKDCKKQVYYNKYENCFKHRGLKPDEFEPETDEHKTMKEWWYKNFPLYNSITLRKKEYWLEDQVADVYFELRETQQKVAIECQNTPITKKKLNDRTQKYAAKDIFVLWIFNGLGTCVSEKKNPFNMDKVRVLGEEKRVHNLYGGRVYYMNVKGEEVIEEPYSLHFSPYFENKKLETSIYGHDKYYKEFQSATVGNIPTYKIVCNEYNGHKLARFMDKNVNITCIERLLTCIREICFKRVEEGNIGDGFEFTISVNSVIELVEEEFGYFLPYLILKRSKRIKKVRFGKTINENYNVQEVLTFKTTDYL